MQINLNKTILICIVCCLSFFCATKTAICACNDIQGFETAAKLLNKGMYLESLGVYQEIANHSNDANNKAKALLLYGTTCSLYLDQYDEALKQFENIIKFYPNTLSAQDALFNNGMILYENGNFKKAYEFFNQYIKKYPNGVRRQSAQVWADFSNNQSATAKNIKPHYSESHSTDTIIRILLKNKANRLTINSAKIITVSNTFTKETIYYGRGPLIFTKTAEFFALNGHKINASKCRITSDTQTVMLDNSHYRGFIIISAEAEGLCAVNHVPVEQYLYGVVPKEMPYTWPKHALMAQSVAARTYALYIKKKSANKSYDVEASTSSQVYGGYGVEKTESNSAIDETRNQIIIHDGKLIIAYFHSNSGGHTENSQNVWSAALPYLKGVPDKFSKNIPNSAWEYSLPYDTIRKQLNNYGMNIEFVKELKPIGKSQSGRILKMMVFSDKVGHEITSNNFRIKIGATKIRSALFQVEPYPQGVLIKGKGYGHGVGMSQWGARNMAQAGFNYQNILKHYYKDVKITTVDGY